MNPYQKMVREFHQKFDCTIGETPAIRDQILAADLIYEESIETIDALERGDIVEAIDGLCDLIYVAFGAAIRLGIDLDPFFVEVHRSNMDKTGGDTRADGKILKPAGWQAPKIFEILAHQTAQATGAQFDEASGHVLSEDCPCNPTVEHIPGAA